MGYIRSNEDYYINQGMCPNNARRQVKRDKVSRGIDHGICNPYKSKIAAEEERKVDKDIEKNEEENGK